MSRTAQRGIAAVVVLVMAGLLLYTAPTGSDFWWSDAPRNALNGAFVKDLIQDHPIHDAKQWAIQYYVQYPALTILFYPPLFYFPEALMFSILGVTHFAAQLTVSLFVLILGGAAYGIARMFLPFWSAAAVSVLTLASPGVAFWGRQVMLDVPAYACIVLSAYFFACYMREPKSRFLYLMVLATLSAVYIRFNSAFIVLAFTLVLFVARGFSVLRDRHVLGALALGFVGMIPAIVLTVMFGKENLASVGGVGGDLPRTSLAAWTFYAKYLPENLGLIVVVLGAIGAIFLIVGRPTERWMAWLLISWFVIGYICDAVINHREPRYEISILFPLVICAVLSPQWIMSSAPAQAISVMLAAGCVVYVIAFDPTPAVKGYAEVVDYITSHAPKDGVVLYDAANDGSFIFDMREHEERHDIVTIRANKLLLTWAVDPDRGLTEKDYDAKEIAATLRKLGVDYIVYQPGFWENLKEMQRLSTVVHSDSFQKVATVHITGDVDQDAKVVEIYTPTYQVTKSGSVIHYDLPIISEKIQSTIR